MLQSEEERSRPRRARNLSRDRGQRAVLRALPGEAVIEDHDFVGSTLPLAQQPSSGLDLRAETFRSPFGLLQLLCDLAQLALRLRAETAQSNLLDSVCDRSDQQLAAEMWGSIGFVETAPLLAKLVDVERGEARQRLLAGLPSPADGLRRSQPVHGPALGILASRHVVTGMAQAGDGGAHGVRQPAEPPPELGDRGALGPL